MGFRYFVRHAARALHLAGYVLNRPDGAVELEAEGDADAIARLRHTVQHGPPGAAVSRLEELSPTASVLDLPFAIRR